MKTIWTIAIGSIAFLLQECATRRVSGNYVNVSSGLGGEHLNFSNHPNTFEYYSKTEGAIAAYSTGTWKKSERKIFLCGFNDNNRNELNVESKVEDNLGEYDNITIRYKANPLDTFIKVDLLLNGNFTVRILGDTTFRASTSIKALQVKAFLVSEGVLFATTPTVDTLYSSRIDTISASNHKTITLAINVMRNSFYRIKIVDTLTVKNKRILIWGNRQFKKATL